MAHVTEPAPAQAHKVPQPIPDAYSVAGDNQHRAAQAHDVAAHHAGETVEAAKSKSKRVEDHNVAKLVQEENESKGKFPKYPGLERFELLEKMGDGAFSNVYRARDLTGDAGECAIKVVRKYEMNNMQVSCVAGGFSLVADHVFFSVSLSLFRCFGSSSTLFAPYISLFRDHACAK